MRPTVALTRRQREVYDFVRDFIAAKGYSPSYEEIGVGVGLQSLATIWKHIKNLEKKRLVTCRYNSARSITLRKELPRTERPDGTCPLCGARKPEAQVPA